MFRSSLMAVMLTASTVASAQQPITAMDLLLIKQITSVDVAPNGSFAVYTLKSIVRDGEDENGLEKYDYRTHLWIVPLNDPNGAPTALTHGDRDDTSPRISPDGAQLAFVRQAAKKEDEKERPKPQVWVMPLDRPGEARQVTELEHGAVSPTWRPDGGALLVTSPIPFSKLDGAPDWDSERPRRSWDDATVPDPKSDQKVDARPDGDRQSVRNWLERNALKNSPAVYNRLAFQDETSIKGEESFAHLFLIELGDETKATQLTRGFRNHGDASFSPDGSLIAFVDKPRTKAHPDRFFRTSIYLMNADGSNVRVFQDDESVSFNSPRFTRDGRSIVFAATDQDELLYRQSRLGMAPIGGGRTQWLAEDWTSDQTNAVVVDSGVYTVSPWNGGFPLLFAPFRSSGQSHINLTDHTLGVHAFDAEGSVIAAAITSVDNPCELFVLKAPNGQPRQLTNHNTGWISQRALSKPTERWITRPEGERIQYWVMPPTNMKRGERYPVVLEIHGGPMAMWGPGEFSMWHEFQLLCAWGYGVVYSNPRGSGGYGYEFQRANHQNWGEAPMGDVLACLDDAMKRNDWIDEKRQFVTGGSYAGYLTAWIIGHTDRFQAAVAQRGVYDLTTFFGEGNAWLLVEHAMGGFPWQPEIREVLHRESPFSYVDLINTPFLIMHGSSDLRTGVTQSEMMYRALKELRKPVEYVRYPGEGHELSRSGNPRLRLDRLMRIVEFFERYADNPRPAPSAPASASAD